MLKKVHFPVLKIILIVIALIVLLDTFVFFSIRIKTQSIDDFFYNFQPQKNREISLKTFCSSFSIIMDCVGYTTLSSLPPFLPLKYVSDGRVVCNPDKLVDTIEQSNYQDRYLEKDSLWHTYYLSTTSIKDGCGKNGTFGPYFLTVNPNTSSNIENCITQEHPQIYEDIQKAMEDPLHVCALSIVAPYMREDLYNQHHLNEIDSMQNLVNLSVQELYPTTGQLPFDIGKLTHLKALNLDDNNLTSLPSDIGNLTQLQELDLSDNSLTSLPPEMENLKNLRILILTGYKNSFSPYEMQRIRTMLPNTDIQFPAQTYNNY